MLSEFIRKRQFNLLACSRLTIPADEILGLAVMKNVRIFLSSPGDCPDERAAVHAVVELINQDPVVATFAHLSVVAWDWGAGVPLDALNSPQVSVNSSMPVPEACNVFIGVFRCRFGSPLPKSEFRYPDGTQFLSGSEYEFYRAWDARRRGAANPNILMYRWSPMVPACCPIDEQHSRLQKFFDGPPFKDGDQWTGSHDTFADTEGFSKKVEGHLRALLARLSPGSPKPLQEWLRERASILAADAGPRYTSSAHVKTHIGRAFDWLLMRKQAIVELDSNLRNVYKAISAESIFDTERGIFDAFAAKMRADNTWWRTADYEPVLVALERIENIAWREIEQLRKPETTKSADKKAQVQERREHRLSEISSAASSAVKLLKKYTPLGTKRVLLLTGQPGQGKTHTMVHEVCKTVRLGGLAIGVLGQTLGATEPLWDAIKKRVQWNESIDKLLDALENEAATRGERALVLIDALNETPIRTRWRGELLGMMRQILARPNLVLAVSVRSDYLRQVVPEIPHGDMVPWVQWSHQGFAGIEPEALAKYFEFFGVKALAAPPLGEFNNPLYVQLLAKSLKGKELSHWQPSWMAVWDTWIERIEQDAVERLGLDDASRRRPLRRLMHRLAEAMLDAGLFSLERVCAEGIARDLTGVSDAIAFLCSSGALVDRVDENDNEFVEFGFERLSDTFICNRLLLQIFGGAEDKEVRREALKAALSPRGFLAELASQDWSDHPLRRRRAGLLESICLAAPPMVGCELPELIPPKTEESHDWEFSQAFVDSFRWRSAESEFGTTGKALQEIWNRYSSYLGEDSQVDELIRLGLMPGHPMGMQAFLHPILQKWTLAKRDASWSIRLPSLWATEDSNLRQLVNWACETDLSGVHTDVALPAAQLLAWICATSQNGLRAAATRALARMIAACHAILPEFLPDFLEVNDPYVEEAALVAVWGVLLEGESSTELKSAAEQVFALYFGNAAKPRCHVTLRHYARRIIETAHDRGLLNGVDLAAARPPYRSELPLNDVPDIEKLEAMSDSKGFRTIVHSSTKWDFYRYVMGGNSASLEISGRPLPASGQPARPFCKSESYISRHTREDIFDLALAGRFVAWNTLSLGYTGDYFDEFDTGYQTREYGRSAGDGRTERIGKKYQWIGWYTLLAFLADNYEMRPDWDKTACVYSGPEQLGIQLLDPARWLHSPGRKVGESEKLWDIPTLPEWPVPEIEVMQEWISSRCFDLPPFDVLMHSSDLPEHWGEGPWLRFAAEHIWKAEHALGYWGKGQDFHADIWWQMIPVLVNATDLPRLLESVDDPKCQGKLRELGRIDVYSDWNAPLSAWNGITPAWDSGMEDGDSGAINGWLPIPYRPLIAECGHPDRSDEHAPIYAPMPSVAREWGLDFRLRDGLLLSKGEPVFGLASALNARSVLFARAEPLVQLLASSGHSLVWFFKGERRAFLNLHRTDPVESVWANYYGIGYLTADGRPLVAWLEKNIERGNPADDNKSADCAQSDEWVKTTEGLWQSTLDTTLDA